MKQLSRGGLAVIFKPRRFNLEKTKDQRFRLERTFYYSSLTADKSAGDLPD